MSENIYRVSLRQARSYIMDCLYAGLVPMVHGDPGVGKSAVMRSVGQELNLHLIDHRISTSSPEDFSGLPRFNSDGHAYFAPFVELFPIQGTPIPAGKDGWLIHLDEINSAPRLVMAAAYKLLLDRMTGQHHLHERAVLAASGNLETSNAIVNSMGTALQSRLVHIEVAVNFEEWLEDVAIPQNYDSRIIAYLSRYPSRLMDFRPDHEEKTFACPRTWEFMNRLVTNSQVTDDRIALYAGTLTSGVAVDFVQFCKIYKEMVSYEAIVADPENCVIPEDISLMWATITHLAEKTKEHDLQKVVTYVERFPFQFKVLCAKMLLIRNKEWREHPAVSNMKLELAKYLWG